MPEQKIIGLVIFTCFLIMIGFAVWKSVMTKGKMRIVLLFIWVSFIVAGLILGIMHVLSSDGLIERST